jgi:hypothetical protein
MRIVKKIRLFQSYRPSKHDQTKGGAIMKAVVKKTLSAICVLIILLCCCSCGTQQEITSQISPSPSSSALPGGPLIEEAYYAVLPGEGPYLNVFDCYGNLINTFKHTNGGKPPMGLFTRNQLSRFCCIIEPGVTVQMAVQPDLDNGKNLLYSMENGYYQISRRDTEDIVYLFSLTGNLVRTVSRPHESGNMTRIGVVCHEGETIICIEETIRDDTREHGHQYSTAFFLVSPTGEINNTITVNSGLNRVEGLLARQYYFISDGAHRRIFDLNGYCVKSGDYFMTASNGVMCLAVAVDDYFQSYYDSYGTFFVYDASLQGIARNTTMPGGELIFGAEYVVQGILCVAKYEDANFYWRTEHEWIAVGEKDGMIAIKTKDSEYVFASNGNVFGGMNKSLLLMENPGNGEVQIIALKTGKVLFTVADMRHVKLADHYVIVRTGQPMLPSPDINGFCIIDNNGTIRYMASTLYADPSQGEYIILYRGPYVGIADLNGDWIMKTLKPSLARDA